MMKPYDFSALNVLIVDDNAPMRKILRSVLWELKITSVEEARNGEHALSVCETFRPDVIITDYRMDPMDGVELTQKIRDGDTRLDPYVPIIMVSGHTEMDRIVRARDAGITEFLAKPISAKMLYYRLRVVAENPRQFVRTHEFFGPDRRRRFVDDVATEKRVLPHEYGAGKVERQGDRAV